MAPRTAKRARRTVAAPVAPATIIPTTTGSKSKSNATTDLPAELLLEIASYFRSVPIHELHGGYHLETHQFALERQDALRAMSQTCSSWRSFFRPLLWENVEMAGTRLGKGQWFAQCANTLLEKCREIVEVEEVAKYVRGMRFLLSTHCMNECLEILAKAMKACPNLKTVNVYFAQTDSARTIKATFDGSVLFGSVERVILPSQAHAILRCCPNVKEVVNHQGDGSQIVTAMQTKCKKVEVLGGVCPDMSMMKRLVKAAPNLREIRFGPGYRVPYGPAVELLGSFKHLRSIHMKCYSNVEEDKVEEYFKSQLDMMKKVLHKCTVTMTPWKWQYAQTNPLADPGQDYEHKVYIK